MDFLNNNFLEDDDEEVLHLPRRMFVREEVQIETNLEYYSYSNNLYS